MPRTRTALVAALAVATAGGCATPTEQRAKTADRLAAFSSTLAQAGMSVPLPPRVCEDVERVDAVTFRNEPGCVSVPSGAGPDDAVRVYARAIVAERLPPKDDARADALADAFLQRSDALPALALDVERTFDARRSPQPPPAAKPTKTATTAKTAPTAKALLPPAAPSTGVREKLVGTWTTSAGALVVVHALCADARWVMRMEGPGEEIPPERGTWEATDGEPAQLVLTSEDGERIEVVLLRIGEQSNNAEVVVDGVAGTFARRATTATCD